MGEPEALELFAAVNEIFAAKGKKLVHLNVKRDKPAPEEVTKLLLGPTGNLRAPTLRVGKKLLVGFNLEAYSEVFDV